MDRFWTESQSGHLADVLTAWRRSVRGDSNSGPAVDVIMSDGVPRSLGKGRVKYPDRRGTTYCSWIQGRVKGRPCYRDEQGLNTLR